MFRTDAVYQDGVFKPLSPVTLYENQRVSLDIKPLEQEDATAWIERVSKHREQLAAKYGVMPDSAIDIAEDRAR